MKRMRGWLAGLVLLAGIAPAAAQVVPIPFLTGPQDPSQMNATINGVIVKLNAIFGVQIRIPAGATNFVIDYAATTGGIATETVSGPSVDTNASYGVAPNGSGNIVLFAPNPATGGGNGTGYLQLANANSFVRSTALATCPGSLANKGPTGLSSTITGYFVFKDWLGQSHGIPAC